MSTETVVDSDVHYHTLYDTCELEKLFRDS